MKKVWTNYRSHLKLQVSYKVYLHPSSYKNYNFLKTTDPTAMAMAVAGATVSAQRVCSHHRSPWRLDSCCSIVLTNLKSSYIFKNQKNNIKNKNLFNLLCVRNFVGPHHCGPYSQPAWSSLDTFLPFICSNKNSLVFCLTEFVNFVNLVNKQVGPNLYVKK
jgi:hypothetical protein